MEYQDWGGIETKESRLKYVPAPEEQKVRLALWVLLGVFTLFVLSVLACLFNPQSGDKIFETSKTVLPPFATLVLGYFFSRS